MITVEMMVSRLEAGEKLENAATYAFKHTALPMLTGTLVTVCGVHPDRLQFVVGGGIYPQPLRRDRRVLADQLDRGSAVRSAARRQDPAQNDEASLRRAGPPHANVFRGPPRRHAVAVGHDSVFLSHAGRLDLWPALRPAAVLPEFGQSRTAGRHDVAAECLDRRDQGPDGPSSSRNSQGQDDIESWSSYVGEGAIRFYLPLDQQLANEFFGQMVVVTKSIEARERVQARLRPSGTRRVRRNRRLRAFARPRTAGRATHTVPDQRSRHGGGASAGLQESQRC